MVLVEAPAGFAGRPTAARESAPAAHPAARTLPMVPCRRAECFEIADSVVVRMSFPPTRFGTVSCRSRQYAARRVGGSSPFRWVLALGRPHQDLHPDPFRHTGRAPMTVWGG